MPQRRLLSILRSPNFQMKSLFFFASLRVGYTGRCPLKVYLTPCQLRKKGICFENCDWLPNINCFMFGRIRKAERYFCLTSISEERQKSRARPAGKIRQDFYRKANPSLSVFCDIFCGNTASLAWSDTRGAGVRLRTPPARGIPPLRLLVLPQNICKKSFFFGFFVYTLSLLQLGYTAALCSAP